MPAATGGPIAELGALMRSVEELDAPPADLNKALQACWYARKGKFTGTGTIPCTEPNWVRAHTICAVPDADINMMWVRGLLHRVEGDLQNAEHWYRKASRELYKGSFADEFREIAGTLLGEIITWGTPEFRALAVVKAEAAREHAGAGPMAYIQALGYDEVPHGSRQADLANGSFWDHLVGVEEVMRGWGMPETLCLAGLYHSVYGTEGFQLYTLPLTEREVVRSVIGERGELAVFYNCVMDRSSLDRLVVAVAAQPAGPPDEVVGTLKARPGLLGLPDGKVFKLTRQQLKDVCILYVSRSSILLYSAQRHRLVAVCSSRLGYLW
jgi:hypothetical protein